MPRPIRLHCNRASKSAMVLIKGLREAGVNAKRIKRRDSRYSYPPNHTVLNWGCTSVPDTTATVINSNESVRNSSDKVETLRSITNPVPWTTERTEAELWLMEDSNVYCRTLTRASEGSGIVVTHPGEELTSAPLYTNGIQISREIRVHLFDGSFIHYAQKNRIGEARRIEENIELDEEVRNTKGGWIFSIVGVDIPQHSKDAAIEAVSSLGLTFGAVDIIISDGEEESFVLEVNSAPGIAPESSTLGAYVNGVVDYNNQ